LLVLLNFGCILGSCRWFSYSHCLRGRQSFGNTEYVLAWPEQQNTSGRHNSLRLLEKQQEPSNVSKTLRPRSSDLCSSFEWPTGSSDCWNAHEVNSHRETRKAKFFSFECVFNMLGLESKFYTCALQELSFTSVYTILSFLVDQLQSVA